MFPEYVQYYIGYARCYWFVGLEQISPGVSSEEMEKATKNMLVSHKTLAEARSSPVKRKVDRNDPCFCGSGKKFKKCCLDSL